MTWLWTWAQWLILGLFLLVVACGIAYRWLGRRQRRIGFDVTVTQWPGYGENVRPFARQIRAADDFRKDFA